MRRNHETYLARFEAGMNCSSKKRKVISREKENRKIKVATLQCSR
jgi:hypothetical protein